MQKRANHLALKLFGQMAKPPASFWEERKKN